MTDGQRGATVPPSRGSIVTRAMATFLAIYGTFWAAMTGETFDGRNLVGFLVGIIASVAMVLQTANRFHLWLEAKDAAKERAIEARIQAARARQHERDDEVDSDARA